jgi:hypothetical protein
MARTKTNAQTPNAVTAATKDPAAGIARLAELIEKAGGAAAFRAQVEAALDAGDLDTQKEGAAKRAADAAEKAHDEGKARLQAVRDEISATRDSHADAKAKIKAHETTDATTAAEVVAAENTRRSVPRLERKIGELHAKEDAVLAELERLGDAQSKAHARWLAMHVDADHSRLMRLARKVNAQLQEAFDRHEALIEEEAATRHGVNGRVASRRVTLMYATQGANALERAGIGLSSWRGEGPDRTRNQLSQRERDGGPATGLLPGDLMPDAGDAVVPRRSNDFDPLSRSRTPLELNADRTREERDAKVAARRERGE